MIPQKSSNVTYEVFCLIYAVCFVKLSGEREKEKEEFKLRLQVELD